MQDVKKKKNFKEFGREGVDWTDLAQDRDALSKVTNLKLP
jgi:hypothetical protein